ncbi:glutamate receptor ionotropic, delta-2-like [Scylla paramamosain]|uniref:glutamate receptor ionotropic, delta-2-like n=1 Tax=Scylla paramamosain TaxID=85552 RepID=UPI0030837214
MLLRVQESKETVRVGVFVASPFSAPTSRVRRVASWTPKAGSLPSDQRLFPEKFHVFTSAPTLKVAIELLPHHSISWVEDPETPGGGRLDFTGYMDRTIRYFAKGMNFTPKYVLSPERTFGTKLPDGSWTGMMGMVVREEVDFGAGPFMLSPVRAAAGDHTTTIWTGNVKMVSGLRGLKINPWGFLLPLTPLVWTATLTALFGVLSVLQLLSSCLPDKTLCRGGWSANTFSPVRVLLQQDVAWPTEWWWWQRMVLGLWMLMTLVLSRSYAGNLMSLLAVRYVPQPFQTPRDVLNDPHVAMIWQKYSKNEQFLRVSGMSSCTK